MGMDINYKHNDLFTPGPISSLNACVGTNGGPYDFQDYAHGYFLAAKYVLNQLRLSGAYADTLVYPLTYLYRHGIELSLKGLTRDLNKVFSVDGEVEKTHRLYDNWNKVRSLLQRQLSSFDPDGDRISLVDKILKDFLEFDPQGEVFRFPEDRRGEPYLQDASIINVEVLGSVLEWVGETFQDWFHTTEKLAESVHRSRNERARM